MSDASHPWLPTYAELGLDWSALPELPALTLSGYIREFATRFPNREALVYLGSAISYAELDRLADRFARALLVRGCSVGDVVGIHLPNTPQYVVAFVAAARIGAVVTSVSPLLKPPEISHQANDAKIRVLLTLAPLFEAAVAPAIANIPSLQHVVVSGPADLMPGATPLSLEPKRAAKVEIEAFDSVLGAVLGEGEVEPVAEAGLFDELAYLQYTGGTTGSPKGAQLSHRNLLINNAQADVFCWWP